LKTARPLEGIPQMPDRAYPWLTHTSITVQPNGVQLALKRACHLLPTQSQGSRDQRRVLFKIQQGRVECGYSEDVLGYSISICLGK